MGLKIIDTVTQPLGDIDDSVPCISRRIALGIDYFPSLDGTGCFLVAFLEKTMPINELSTTRHGRRHPCILGAPQRNRA
jgi:hypothetical protein